MRLNSINASLILSSSQRSLHMQFTIIYKFVKAIDRCKPRHAKELMLQLLVLTSHLLAVYEIQIRLCLSTIISNLTPTFSSQALGIT